jgi:hypothetical protein
MIRKNDVEECSRDPFQCKNSIFVQIISIFVDRRVNSVNKKARGVGPEHRGSELLPDDGTLHSHKRRHTSPLAGQAVAHTCLLQPNCNKVFNARTKCQIW